MAEEHERDERELEAEERAEEQVEDTAPVLDPEVEARRVAAMSFIRRLGDPILKSRATPVDRYDDSLKGQVARMAGLISLGPRCQTSMGSLQPC